MLAPDLLETRTLRRSLPYRRSLVLDDAKDTTVQVDRGTVWLTLEHDTRDIVVDEGRAFRIPRQGRTIITAEAPTRLTLLQPPALVVRWLARVLPPLARWMRRSLERRCDRLIPYF